jgi:hypothetical protein
MRELAKGILRDCLSPNHLSRTVTVGKRKKSNRYSINVPLCRGGYLDP